MTLEHSALFDTWETTFPEPLQRLDWRNETALFTSDVALSAIAHRFGPCVPGDDHVPGLGPSKLWISRFACGCELALLHLELAPAGRQLGVLSNDPDIDHVLHHFAFPANWRIDAKEAPLPVEIWSLFRQDDNGNRFHIRDFDSKFSADCARREFEGRGHKQLYTTEKR